MARLSVLSHTHTPPANRTSRWAGKMTTPIIPLSPRRHWALFGTFPLTILHCRPSSHRGTSCSSRRGFILFGITQQGGDSFLAVIYIFCWECFSHTNVADDVGVYIFPYILGYCSFLRWLVGCCFPTFVSCVFPL